MNILMMTNTYAPIVGGLEKSIQIFTESLRKHGHKVLVVAPEFEGMPEKENKVVRVPAVKDVAHTSFSINLPIPGLASKTIEAFQPDVIHTHHPFFVGDMALRMAGQYNIPLVFTYHTNFEDYTHMLPLDNDGTKQFLIQLSAGFANMADRVIVPSESIRRVLKRRDVKTTTHVVPTGVDVESFGQGSGVSLRKKLGIAHKAFVVGHLGRLSDEKNLDFLMEPLCLFLQKKRKAHVLVIGKGPAEEEMKRYFKRGGVNERVHFPGVLRDQDLIDAYHAMDIFAFASKSETQGMVVTEAMASGLPVVALDAPGVREVVKDKVNGRLLKKENVLAFTDAMEWCCDKEEASFDKLVAAANKTAKDFSIEKCTTKALRVYKQAIHSAHDDKDQKTWDEWVGRIQTEWGLLKNLGQAIQSSIKS